MVSPSLTQPVLKKQTDQFAVRFAHKGNSLAQSDGATERYNEQEDFARPCRAKSSCSL